MWFSHSGNKDDVRQKEESEQILQNTAFWLSKRFDLSESRARDWLSVEKNKVSICLPFAYLGERATLTEEWRNQVMPVEDWDLEWQVQVMSAPVSLPLVGKIKNIIAVASGKGGVGKSTSSVNLAYALMAEGAQVGILDADIYGPSIPIMLGNATARPQSEDNKHMQPLRVNGVVANSIGYLIDPNEAAIWRGPVVSRALQQLLNETLWGELDYLIVDLPPGTGDIQLTLAQQVPLSAAVIVTTPQDLALADAKKAVAMFNKVTVPVLGVIENMSYYQCGECGHKAHVFSSGGGEKLAHAHGLALLAQLPLEMEIREHADEGKPLLTSQPQSGLTETYRRAARALALALYRNGLSSEPIAITVTE